MEEIEIKVLNIDVKDISKKILNFGAEKVSENLIIEKHFDFDDKRLSKRGDLFRVRKVDDKVEIAYKALKGIDEFSIYDEIETGVGDFDRIVSIIERVGMKCVRYREKRRTSFRKGDLKFEIDKYPDIPAYLEIEGDGKNIKKALRSFLIEDSNVARINATQVLKLYNVNSNYQRFRSF